MKKDIVIIGGGPAGMITALTSKSMNPDKSVLFIRREARTLTPCGIPYIFNRLGNVEKDLVPDDPFLNQGIEIKIAEVTNIDKDKKCVFIEDDCIEYDKLVFATGSEPYIPTWLPGTDLEGVYVIKKDHKYLENVKNNTDKSKIIAVIGAGFIGVEVAEELADSGKTVYLIEKMESILGNAFDSEFVVSVQEKMNKKNIKILCKTGVKEIIGNSKVNSILLDNGDSIEVDSVILAMGYRPNTQLAEKSGLFMGKNKNIWVDEYMRTSDDNIFAVGDCAERRHFITRRPVNTMLASTATSEARVAGSNLFNLSSIKSFYGTIAVFSTRVCNIVIGSAGITEKEAGQENIEVISSTFECLDKHPGTLEGANKQKVKLIAAKKTGVIVGGQILGSDSSSELINVIGYIIQNGMRADEVFVSQIGTHPLTTAAPTKYPIIKAAEMLLKKIK